VIPFLHLGPLTIPTFGLMVACAMLSAFFVLRADLERRGLAASTKKTAPSKIAARSAPTKSQPKDAAGAVAAALQKSSNAEAEILIAVPCMVGLAGAKLYHLMESPAEFFAHPLDLLVSPYGFAWFGGLLAGFAAFLWVGRRQHIPLLTLFDAGSPAAALGYGIGRIGCFLSGDGDYGIPTSLPWGMSFPNGLVPTTDRVHPTPIYELIVACAIAWFLWRLGTRQIAAGRTKSFVQVRERVATPEELALLNSAPSSTRHPSPSEVFMTTRRSQFLRAWRRPQPGSVFAAYLVLTGLARFLVEFIRINPRGFLGMSNAQAAALASMIVGAALWMWLLKRRDQLT
jgi:phosphatidylglycerol---prolipoprotein diacylglyceryl transferase